MLESLQKWRTENPNDKTIVISLFVQALDMVADYLKEHDFKYVR
jgi:SNF2 family DNA or RNA helicase